MQVLRDAVDLDEYLHEYDESEPITKVNLANKEQLPSQRVERQNSVDRVCVDVAAALARAEDNDHNSLGLAHIFESLKHVFCEEIQKMDSLPVNLPLHPPGPFNMADLRCCTSPNTISPMVTVYEEIRKRYARDYSTVEQDPAGPPQQLNNMPEVMAFFQGLPTSDFNSLFRSLRPPTSLDGGQGQEQGFFVSGVPGTLYGRLFPAKMLHVVMSIMALQWLSQLPPGVVDKNSPTFNRGRIWLQGAEPEVEKEYWQQFRKDFIKFLVCRAQEVATGGLLLLLLPGTADPRQAESEKLPAFGLFEKAWDEMVSEGRIDPEERDSFNLPVYLPTPDELKQVIEEVNSSGTTSDCFEIRRLQYFENMHIFPEVLREALQRDAICFGRMWTKAMRSQLNGLVEQHLNCSLTNTLFRKMDRLATEHADEVIPKLNIGVIVAVLVCRRQDTLRRPT